MHVYTNDTMNAVRTAGGPMRPGSVGVPATVGFNIGDIFGGIGKVLEAPFNLVSDVVSNIPIVGDIVSPVVDTVRDIGTMPWHLGADIFGGGQPQQQLRPPALPQLPRRAPLPAAPGPTPMSPPAPGVLTPRTTPQPPADASAQQLKNYLQQILFQPIPADMMTTGGVTLPRFAWMDTLTAGRDFLIATARKCGLGPNPMGDPLVNRWMSINNEFLRYVGNSQWASMAQQLQQQLVAMLPQAAAQCGAQQAPALPGWQPPAPAPQPGGMAGEGACPSGQYFRNKCIPQHALPCPTGKFNAKVDMDGVPLKDKRTGLYKIWCMKGPRKEDIITQIAPGFLMRQPAITPYPGFTGRRRRVIRPR